MNKKTSIVCMISKSYRLFNNRLITLVRVMRMIRVVLGLHSNEYSAISCMDVNDDFENCFHDSFYRHTRVGMCE